MSAPANILAASFAVLSLNSGALNAEMVDPTRPPTWGAISAAVPRTVPRKQGLELQTTLVSPGRRMAIINGKSYTVGSNVGAAKIVEINPFEVILEKAGSKTTLRLLPRVNRSPAATNRKTK